MTRARSRGLVETLLIVGAKIPWLMSLAAATVLFVVLHLAANMEVSNTTTTATMGQFVLLQFVRTASGILQYIVPALLLIGTIASAFIRKHRRELHAAVTGSSHRNAGRELSWRQFEQFIGANFALQGFEVEETGQSGPDGGIDLKLRRGKDTYLVQCKQWRARQVGVGVVRELYGVMASVGAVGGFVVTYGTFSDEARKFAAGREVELIDGRKLDALLRENHSPKPIVTKPVKADPACPTCGSPMLLRVARKGVNAGESFWGCRKFPACRGTLPS